MSGTSTRWRGTFPELTADQRADLLLCLMSLKSLLYALDWCVIVWVLVNDSVSSYVLCDL